MNHLAPSKLRLAKQVASHPAAKSFATQVQSNMPAGTASETAQAQAAASADQPTFASVGVRNTDVQAKPGVTLTDHQKVLVGSVLDLFAGHPTLPHLRLWARDATFRDPLSTAQGFDRFAAQWYGLPALFSPIRIRSHAVTSAGNPIEVELSNSYTVKGLGSEQVIDSVVRIDVGPEGKIVGVEDRWSGNLSEGPVVEALRKANAATVPKLVTVPKNDEEDAKLKAEREKA